MDDEKSEKKSVFSKIFSTKTKVADEDLATKFSSSFKDVASSIPKTKFTDNMESKPASKISSSFKDVASSMPMTKFTDKVESKPDSKISSSFIDVASSMSRAQFTDKVDSKASSSKSEKKAEKEEENNEKKKPVKKAEEHKPRNSRLHKLSSSSFKPSSSMPKPAFTDIHDLKMASKQTKIDKLSKQELLEQEEWASEKLKAHAGTCPMGFSWARYSPIDQKELTGYRCMGGSHLVPHTLLAAGAGGVYLACPMWEGYEFGLRLLKPPFPQWEGPCYQDPSQMIFEYQGIEIDREISTWVGNFEDMVKLQRCKNSGRKLDSLVEELIAKNEKAVVKAIVDQGLIFSSNGQIMKAIGRASITEVTRAWKAMADENIWGQSHMTFNNWQTRRNGGTGHRQNAFVQGDYRQNPFPQSSSGQSAYGQGSYGHSTSGQSAYGLHGSGNNSFGQSASAQNAQSQMASAMGTIGQTIAGHTGYGQCASGQSGYGQNASAMAVYGQAASAAGGYGQAGFASSGYGQGSYGDSFYSQARSGAAGYGGASYGSTSGGAAAGGSFGGGSGGGDVGGFGKAA